MSYYLPNETAKAVAEQVRTCRNLGLILDKYIPISVFQKPEKNDKNKGKTPWLLDILKPTNAENKQQLKHFDLKLAESTYQRWLFMTKSMGALHFSASIDWRMIVGLGGETVLETDLTLHHLYGFPYIPGSALKGLTRAYVAREIYKSANQEDDNDEVKRIFGSQEQAGAVVFFDAMPLNGKATFELDIMNPHYPDYYGKGNAPTNDQNPNPITFLTVAKTSFMFALAPRNPDNEKHKKDVEETIRWLQEALQNYGIGGKTSAGYGYFKDIHDEQESTSEQASVPKERIRPPIPNFRTGQEITGAVIAATDELRQYAPAEAKAFLRYQSFSTKDVLIIVSAEETQNWKPGETRICQFMKEEEHSGCTVLVCQPRPAKNKDKKKR